MPRPSRQPAARRLATGWRALRNAFSLGQDPSACVGYVWRRDPVLIYLIGSNALQRQGKRPARGSGGTGRRTSLRGWRSQERGGSNPPFRTIRLASEASELNGAPSELPIACESRGFSLASYVRSWCPERAP